MFTNKKIVLIDDDKVTIKYFSKQIEANYPGNDFKAYDKYDESLKYHEIDALIIDFYLSPEIDCLTIIKEFRKLYPKLLIISVSSSFVNVVCDVVQTNNKLMKDCLNAGASRVCPKNVRDIMDLIDYHFKVKELEPKLVFCK